MRVTTMKQMWTLLAAHTVTPDGKKRPVNHMNEWGGFSEKLSLPVFTAWVDLTTYDKVSKSLTALVSDTRWASAVGVNNQERWLKFAEENCGGEAAFFIIHAVNPHADPRKVKFIDDDAIFVGQLLRKGEQTFIVGHKQSLI